MIIPYTRFRNTSGERVVHQLSFSKEVYFEPNEVIKIIRQSNIDGLSGYCLEGYDVISPNLHLDDNSVYNAWISLDMLTKHFTLENPPKFANQKDLFEYVWEDRLRVSQLSGKPLIGKNSMRFHAQFLHILPKGSYPKWKLNPYNIILALPEEHEIQERYPYFLELRQFLTREYHRIYYNKL